MSALKYYIYISDTKVDMLYAQIPKDLLSRIAAELEINLGIIKTKLSEDVPEETRYSKLSIVLEYFQRYISVGSPANPNAYFHGILPVKWGPLYLTSFKTLSGEAPKIVCFSGESHDTQIHLTGSWHHVIGGGEKKAKDYGGSFASILFFGLLDELERIVDYERFQICRRSPEKIMTAEMSHFENFAYGWSGAYQTVEFLARRYYKGFNSRSRLSNMVIGSPIYVALVD